MEIHICFRLSKQSRIISLPQMIFKILLLTHVCRCLRLESSLLSLENVMSVAILNAQIPCPEISTWQF